MSNGDYESKIIECPACRNGISRRAMMCPTCGHDMRPRGPSNPKLLKYCPACGIAIGTKAFRCPNCGQRQMSNWQIHFRALAFNHHQRPCIAVIHYYISPHLLSTQSEPHLAHHHMERDFHLSGHHTYAPLPHPFFRGEGNLFFTERIPYRSLLNHILAKSYKDNQKKL